MNNQQKYIMLFLSFLCIINIFSCSDNEKYKKEKTELSKNKTSILEESIFNLTGNWHTQNNETIELKELKGKVLVIVMIYTSCKAACPRLVADMRTIEKQMPKDELEELNFVLVSIDPEVDTPSKLKAFSIENKMTASYWTFLRGTKSSVQEFANVLSVKYKEITPMDFSHSNIISVFDRKGLLIHQQEGLGVNNKETIEIIFKVLEQ